MFEWNVWISNVQQEKHTKKYNTRRQETCMLAHQNYVQRNAIHRKYFPRILPRKCTTECDVQEHNFVFPVNPEMDVNNEDGNIALNIPGHFNINTGLWEYESLSKHTPKDMIYPQNVNSTMQRNDFVKSKP